ncbi:MAG: septum formation initiator family protein [Opitutus sp.]|nr:septum formation initiator family protein [Opitutus sp.]
MDIRRYVVPYCVVLLTCGGIWAGGLFVEWRAEYVALKQTQAAGEARVAAAKARLAEQERILDRLHHDPAYVEKVLRQRLGYARPGEVIFRFDPAL